MVEAALRIVFYYEHHGRFIVPVFLVVRQAVDQFADREIVVGDVRLRSVAAGARVTVEPSEPMPLLLAI